MTQSAGDPSRPGANKPPASDPAGPGQDPTDTETEPDARFTFANERTFLAWHRTSLALVVAGLAIVQLLPPFTGIPFGRHLLALPLIILGGVLSVGSYLEWIRNQRALRRGAALGRSVLPLLLAIAITLLALVAATLTGLARARRPDTCAAPPARNHPRTSKTAIPASLASAPNWPGLAPPSPSPPSAWQYSTPTRSPARWCERPPSRYGCSGSCPHGT